MELVHRVGGVAMLLSALPLVTTAGELPKEGSYSGVFAWHFTGQTAGNDANTIWGGAGTGPFLNAAATGFLHASLVVCTTAGSAGKGVTANDRGDCVVTDPQGDLAFATWRCTSCPSAGEFTWVGGTGKYSGLRGKNTYRNDSAGPAGSPAGWSSWKGEWTLP
jgi:hypothetical protein